MGRPYADDLREWVVRLFEGGLSRHQAAAIWGGHQHGDQLGTALPRDRPRQAGPDRRLWKAVKNIERARRKLRRRPGKPCSSREEGSGRVVAPNGP